MPPPIPGTSQVSLQLTGTSSVPNNFNIQIFTWDVGTDAVSTTGRTYASAVSRTATSAVNGGSLTVSPYYGITGITGIDRYVKLTSTTSCTTDSNLISIESAALTVYTPASGILTEDYSGGTVPNYYIDSFAIINGGPNDGKLSSATHPVAQIDTLSYLDAADFSLSYVSGTTVSGGATVEGTYVNGPFSSFSVTKSGKTFSLFGSANTSLDSQLIEIHGIMRLTYTPSGYYVDFDYYYAPTSL